MKKTSLILLLSVCSYCVFAQTDSTGNSNNTGNTNNGTMYNNNSTNSNWNNGTNNNNSMSSSGNYNAYGTFNMTAPPYIQGYMTRDYPMATDVHWQNQQSSDWWHAYYMNNGQPMNVYYNNMGNSFTVALPVRESSIPDDIANRAVSMYGPTLYDINIVKGSTGQDIYAIRTIENGQLNTQWIGADGNKVIDVYRDDNAMNSNMNSNMNGNMNNSQMNSTNQSNANAMMNNTTTTTTSSSTMNRTHHRHYLHHKKHHKRIHKTKIKHVSKPADNNGNNGNGSNQ